MHSSIQYTCKKQPEEIVLVTIPIPVIGFFTIRRVVLCLLKALKYFWSRFGILWGTLRGKAGYRGSGCSNSAARALSAAVFQRKRARAGYLWQPPRHLGSTKPPCSSIEFGPSRSEYDPDHQNIEFFGWCITEKSNRV